MRVGARRMAKKGKRGGEEGGEARVRVRKELSGRAGFPRSGAGQKGPERPKGSPREKRAA